MTSYELTGRGVPRGPAKLLALNWSLILLLCAVACAGFLMLYSVAGGSLQPWAEAQMVRFAAGIVIMVTIGMIDIRYWRLLSAPAYLVSFVLLVAVEVMGVIGMGVSWGSGPCLGAGWLGAGRGEDPA